MRVIEPVGRVSSVPPTPRSVSSQDYFQGSRVDPFYRCLQDALSANQEPSAVFYSQRSGLRCVRWGASKH